MNCLDYSVDWNCVIIYTINCFTKIVLNKNHQKIDFMQREGENLPKELELSPVNIKTRSPALNLSAPLINYVQEMPPIIKESKIEVTNLLPKKEICQVLFI